jgi:hypothetical protein
MDGTPATGIEELVAELEATAARLRQGELEQGEAAALVERCAELAGRIGSQLEREARSAPGGTTPGQEQLL